MQTLSYFVLGATVAVILLVLLYNLYIMGLTAKNIFAGSGKPISMAKVVLGSTQMTAQILFGILVIGIVCVMLIENKIKSDAGLPIVSGIVGYLLGKSFKDVYEGPSKPPLKSRSNSI